MAPGAFQPDPQAPGRASGWAAVLNPLRWFGRSSGGGGQSGGEQSDGASYYSDAEAGGWSSSASSAAVRGDTTAFVTAVSGPDASYSSGGS